MKTLAETPNLQPQIEALTTQVNELTHLVAKQGMLIKYYEEQFLLAQRRRFGASSEKTLIDDDTYRQMNLFNNAAEEAVKSLPEPELEEITYKRKKQTGKREEDLSGLPVERIDHELPETERVCPECGGAMRDIGTEVRRELKLVPAQVVVVEHATHAYDCGACDKTNDHTPIIKAEAPKPLISGSLASPSLVAHIVFQKYLNGLPSNIGALPKSKLGEAVTYATNQRKFLENVFLDGRLEFSNNRCERAIKPFVQGRKAWLFANTPDGAVASSILYSIMETAKANGLHPFNYVKFLLETLPNTTSEHIDALLPWSDSLPEDCTAPMKASKD